MYLRLVENTLYFPDYKIIPFQNIQFPVKYSCRTCLTPCLIIQQTTVFHLFITSYIWVNTGDVHLLWWTLCPLGSGWGSALHMVGWSEQTE